MAMCTTDDDIEVPNSPHERTASSLSFCALLSVSFLRMEASRLEFKQPEFPHGGDRVAFVDNDKLLNTCHFLHAMEKKVFLPGSEHFNGEWLVELRPKLTRRCAERRVRMVPRRHFSCSFFFSKFVGAQCCLVQGYELLQNLGLLEAMEMLDLKHSFCRLLVKTSADFSLRQIQNAHPDIEVTEEFSRAANARVLARALPNLERTVSGGNCTHGVLPRAPPLERQASLNRQISGPSVRRLTRQVSTAPDLARARSNVSGRSRGWRYRAHCFRNIRAPL